MPFKEHTNPKDAMKAIGNPVAARRDRKDPFYKNRPTTAQIPTTLPVATRPGWADVSVVDPTWLKKYLPDVEADGSYIQEPFALLGNEQVRQLKLLFDPKLFEPNNNLKRDSSALDLLGAVIDLLEDVVEIADANPPALKSAQALEKALAPNLLSFLGKVRGLVEQSLAVADDELDRTDFIRGIWEHYIVTGAVESDVGSQEMLNAVVENADTIEIGKILDDLRERIAP